MTNPRFSAVGARTIVPMTGEKAARGRDLAAPLRIVDDGLLVLKDNRVVACGRKKDIDLPPGCIASDLGDVCLIPGVINCHAHVDISHLAGRTRWGSGFSAWLKSLIPLCPRSSPDDGEEGKRIDSARARALEFCATRGTAGIGNICSPVLETLLYLESQAKKRGIALVHFLEAFGTRTRAFHEAALGMRKKCPWAIVACAGHALYSTGKETLRAACETAMASGRRLSLHLAESPEEEEMLASGRGPLSEIFTRGVLPPSWTPPLMRPVAYADALGLLSNLLAVHCVHVTDEEAELLERNNVAVCLCPRSNDNLATGTAPVEMFVDKDLLLCLGTDGLTSSADLDVLNDACFLKEKRDMPSAALLRMLTVNGAYALGLEGGFGRLEPGSPAVFATLPDCLSVP